MAVGRLAFLEPESRNSLAKDCGRNGGRDGSRDGSCLPSDVRTRKVANAVETQS